MADTIIVTPNVEPVESNDGSTVSIGWRCLARRGMLFSEVEGFETLRIPPGGSTSARPHHYSEEVWFVVSGLATGDADGEQLTLTAGDALLVPLGCTSSLRNSGEDDLELITLEFLPGEVADRLPPRAPQLLERA
jgi:quercetin dioxygenase-like cupin family protein